MNTVGRLIGTGNTADVYDFGDQKVVKLFKEGYSKSAIEREYENSRLFSQFDILGARSYEMIMCK